MIREGAPWLGWGLDLVPVGQRRTRLMELKGYFVSDLHLFARRSLAQTYQPGIRHAARHAHTFVLGGDIFDFKWSALSSYDRTIQAARRWLRELVELNPACHYHFILGNHDGAPRFIEKLDEISAEYPHFHWHRYFVRLHDCLFLHGDVADGKIDHDLLDVRRGKWHKESPQSQTSHLLYDLAVRARLHRLASSVAHRERVVLRNILAYSQSIGQGPEDGIQHVYFGHIHRVLDGIRFEGLTFHNGGAAIRGNQFRIIETQLPPQNGTFTDKA